MTPPVPLLQLILLMSQSNPLVAGLSSAGKQQEICPSVCWRCHELCCQATFGFAVLGTPGHLLRFQVGPT